MEFERAIYRVYERCLDGMREDDDEGGMTPINGKSCRIFEALSFSTAIFLLCTLIFLHCTYVGPSGINCLPRLLAEKNISRLEYDQILAIKLDHSITGDFDTPPNNLRAENFNDDQTTGEGRRLWLGDNIGAASKNIIPWDTWSTMTRTWNTYPFQRREISNTQEMSIKKWERMRRGLLIFGQSHEVDIHEDTNPFQRSNNNSVDMFHTKENTTSSSLDIFSIFDYEFGFEIGILALPMEIRNKHGFKTINVTLSGEMCFGSKLAQALLPLGGFDTVVVNNVVNTVRKGGMVMTRSGDYYSWHDRDLHPYHNLGEWIAVKINIFILSLFSFFFLSTTTALLVRVLISSGVVLLFPFFTLLQYFGVNIINSRIISLSYPWIGVPMEMLRSRNQSVIPFIIAHISRVIIFYSFYEACQLSFGMWFYDQARPGQRELWLFAIMMTWEYYSMIYVRAAGSIRLFPRASLALYLLYHFYVYSQPFGFHLLALLVMFLFLIVLMIHCVRKFEVDAYFRGVVSMDQPRAIYNSLPWPSWNVALAPDFSVFLPLTTRSVSVYANEVPAVRQTGTDEADNRSTNGMGEAIGTNVGGGYASRGFYELSNIMSRFISAIRESPGRIIRGREVALSNYGINSDRGGNDTMVQGNNIEENDAIEGGEGGQGPTLVNNFRATIGQQSNLGSYERLRSGSSQHNNV